MKKNKKKIVKTVKKERPPQLEKIISKVLLTCGLYFPVNDENKHLYKIPEAIIALYKKQLEKEILPEEIKIIYKTQRELFGYVHIDSLNQITVVCYSINKEYKHNLVFLLDSLTTNLKHELPENYPLVVRCLLVPNCFFFDKEIPEESLNVYSKNKADYAFYTNIDNYKNSILYNNKIIRNTSDKHFILEYDENVENKIIDKIIDLRIYKNDISKDWLLDTIINYYKEKIINLFKCKSFFNDRKPDNHQELYSTNYITKSLIGFNKIIFLFPENAEISSIYRFIREVFTGALIDNNIDQIDFFNRFSFNIMNKFDMNKIDHKDILNNCF